jgi:alpha-beta hydrolase superfamily lysophospholipase
MTIRAETSTLLTRGIECASYKWIPEDVGKIRGVVVVYHGFGAHSRYPTVHYALSFLAKSFVVYAMDLPGHGASPGVRGLLTGVDDLVGDGIAIANHAIADSSTIKQNVELPLFLIGSSMGGAIALSVANKMSEKINGVVMLAPMLSLNVGSAARMALGLLSMVVPQLPLIPSSATKSERQYRDAERRAECDNDTLTYKGNMR